MGISQQHFTDKNGAPDGGSTTGTGFQINWQKGPLVIDGQHLVQNGAFVEDIIHAAKGRLEYYQTTKFACTYNRDAIALLDEALRALSDRTTNRKERGVEGTHAE